MINSPCAPAARGAEPIAIEVTRIAVYRRAVRLAQPPMREHVGKMNKFRGSRRAPPWSAGGLARSPSLTSPQAGRVVEGRRDTRAPRVGLALVGPVARCLSCYDSTLPFGGRSLDIGMPQKPNPVLRC